MESQSTVWCGEWYGDGNSGEWGSVVVFSKGVVGGEVAGGY